MKTKLIIFSLVASFVSMAGISAAHADIDQTEKATIPFAFYAGNEQMPAGTYDIGIDVENDTISVRSESGRNTALLLGRPASGPRDKSELVFDHAGDRYYLKAVDSTVLDFSISNDRAKLDASEQVSVPVKRS